MTPKELAEYAKICRKHGIASLKMDGVITEITMDLGHAASSAKKSDPGEPETDEMSPEDILLWSSTPAQPE